MSTIRPNEVNPDVNSQRITELLNFVAQNGPCVQKYLHCDGTRQWYGDAPFRDQNYNGKYVLLGDGCFTLARFVNEEEAQSYGDMLKMILIGCGYRRTKIIPLEVYVYETVFTNWRIGTRMRTLISDKPCFLLRMKIKK